MSGRSRGDGFSIEEVVARIVGEPGGVSGDEGRQWQGNERGCLSIKSSPGRLLQLALGYARRHPAPMACLSFPPTH